MTRDIRALNVIHCSTQARERTKSCFHLFRNVTLKSQNMRHLRMTQNGNSVDLHAHDVTALEKEAVGADQYNRSV